MRIHTVLLLAGSLAVSGRSLAQAPSPPIPDTSTQPAPVAKLAEAEAEMFRLFAAGDADGFERIAGADYLTINADGAQLDRAGAKAIIRKFTGIEGTMTDRKERVYGTIGVITGLATYATHGVPLIKFRFTQIWVWRDNRWQFIHWQGTLTGAPTWYPVVLTAIGMSILFAVVTLVRRRRRRLAASGART
jgi:hypothetical protein